MVRERLRELYSGFYHYGKNIYLLCAVHIPATWAHRFQQCLSRTGKKYFAATLCWNIVILRDVFNFSQSSFCTFVAHEFWNLVVFFSPFQFKYCMRQKFSLDIYGNRNEWAICIRFYQLGLFCIKANRTASHFNLDLISSSRAIKWIVLKSQWMALWTIHITQLKRNIEIRSRTEKVVWFIWN